MYEIGPDIDYQEVIDRISSIYSSCLPEEKIIFSDILMEVSDKGYSETLEKIWLADFTEIPVSISTFIRESEYLGDTNNNGQMVYPFWKKSLDEIFTEDKNYYEVILSGATRIGKTSTAITGMAYMLYRLMIYRDPHSYFRKKSVSKFTVAFANLTVDLAKGVGFKEYNSTLKMSPWFNRHGRFTRSDENYYYIPDGDRIEVIPASNSAHLLGKQLWCLTGDTKVATCRGIKPISELAGKYIKLPQYNHKTHLLDYCIAPVVQTKMAKNLIKVAFDDGFVIKGTPEHKVMLADGDYKQLKDLKSGDYVVSHAKYQNTEVKNIFRGSDTDAQEESRWVWVHNDVTRKLVRSENYDKYIEQGFEPGRKLYTRTHVNKDGNGFIVDKKDTEHHLSGGYTYGPIQKMKVSKVETLELDEEIPVYDVVNAGTLHNFFIYDDVSDRYLVSHNCCLLDEVNFTRAGVKDINKAKASMKQLYDTANARITGTFKIRGKVYGKMFTCSSKNSDSDYLSDHIETQLNSGNTAMYLVDEPQWKVLPPEMFSDDTFYIAVGDRYRRGFVIDDMNSDEAHLKAYRDEGYKVLEVPLDFKSNFKADYSIALRDIAGISVVGSMGFITQESVTVNISDTRRNPFAFDIIVCGTRDSETIERNFKMEYLDTKLMKLPVYVHVDFAEVSDHIGICGVACTGNKKTLDAATERYTMMPSYAQLFQVAIECPRGDRMSYQKVVNFLLWLRKSGVNIYKVTTDQFQSSYFREMLQQKSFEVGKISVDTSEDPYIALRNVLQDQRIELIKHQLQEDELVHLQRINNRIDHPPQSTEGSGSADNYSRSGPPGNGYGKGIGKDCADALAGSLWSCIQDSDSFQPDVQSTVNMAKMLNGAGGRVNAMPSVFGMRGTRPFR